MQSLERTTKLQDSRPSGGEPIAQPKPTAGILEEVRELQSRHEVLRDREFSVFLARAKSIPMLLHEIGRERELAFRAVGEGSGRSLDLDRFDETYLHLVGWDRSKSRLVGAYRIGQTDRLLETSGADGLYCSSLFRFEPEFLDYLNPGLELGRSFIALNYQRRHAALGLLWRGIGHFVVENPQYRHLFGAVSISEDYAPISRELIVRFLRKEKRDPLLSRLVSPRNPYEVASEVQLEASQISGALRSVEEVSARIASAEPDGKGIPVLLRQYLKLNATLLSFNVDDEFSRVLDALVLVDLRRAPVRLLKRYMGAGHARFLNKA